MPGPEYIDEFLSTISSHKGFSGNTLSAYRIDLTQFNDYLSSGRRTAVPAGPPVETWRDVSRDSIMHFVLYLKERGYAPTTVARKLAAVRSFFKHLAARGAVPTNPAEELSSPHVDRPLPHMASSSELDALMDKLNAAEESPEVLRDRAMLQLISATGLRVGEMVALNMSDLDMSDGMLATVSASARASAGSGKSRRILVNSVPALEALRDYLGRGRPMLGRVHDRGANLAAEDAEGQALFLNHRGQRLTRQGFWLILKSHARSAGLDHVTPHVLRHSFAAQKLSGGVDIHDLQKMLGHANVSTTQIYARMGDGGKRSAKPGEARRGQRKS